MLLNKEIAESLDFINLKNRIKTEALRRNYNGSISKYGGAEYDYTSVPSNGVVIEVEHYNKIADITGKIDNSNIEVSKMNGDPAIKMVILDSEITRFESQEITSVTNDCKSNCTGMCVTECSTTCSSGCTGTCLHQCVTGCSSCGGSCSNNCSSCGGYCSYNCSGRCDSHCADNCEATCVNGCSSWCTYSCGGYCSVGCQDGCTVSCAQVGKS